MQSHELEAVEVNLDEVFAESTDERMKALAGPLLRLETMPAFVAPEAGTPASSAAMVAALRSVAESSPAAASLFQKSAELGTGMMVVFPPDVMKGLKDGSLRLMNTATGDAATAVNSATGKIVKQGRVVTDSAATGGKAAAATGGATVAALAAPVLIPIAIAGVAAYAQQAQLERALASI